MRLFWIEPCGDPCNRTGWDVHEFQHSFDESACTFRGDLSPIPGKARTIATLKQLYPDCKIRSPRR